VTPIENKLEEALPPWSRDYIEAMMKLRKKRDGVSLVDYHKAKLGRQNRTFFNGEFRFWIWETGSWTVLVSNRKGVCFEVPEMSTRESALEAWGLYKEQMGIA